MPRTSDPVVAPRALLAFPCLAILTAVGTATQSGTPISRTWIEPAAPVVVRDAQAFSPAPVHFPVGVSGARWTYASDGTWIAEVASLGNRGTQVVTQHGDFLDVLPLLSAHDSDPPQPVWADSFVELNFHRAIDSAEETDAHVALHQRFVAGSTQWREAVVRTYDSSSAAPRWEAVLPTPIASHPHAGVRSSRDGSTLVAFVYDGGASSVAVSVFSADSPVPVATASVGTFGAFLGVALSSDGSTAVVLSTLKLAVFDVASASTTHEEFLFGPTVYGSLGLSGDGGTLALGIDAGVRVYERDDAGGWSHAWTHPLSVGGFCRRLALSEDGGTLALGVNFPADVLTSHLEAVDLAAQAVTMSHTVVGAGALQNQVADLSISADGRRIALGLWGDEPGLVPELLVFRSNADAPILSEFLGGSVQDLELSADGRRLVVASKGTHANTWGGGGAVRLFDVGALDLDLLGIPRPGATVELVHRVRPGGASRVYVASALASAPHKLPDLGPGPVYLDADSMVALGDVDSDDEGLATTPYTIPDDAGLIGSSLYFQALALDGTGFSKRWVRMTILP